MSELNMDDDRAAALWNAQADQHNQWSELDADEKAAWIAKCAAPVGEVELPARSIDTPEFADMMLEWALSKAGDEAAERYGKIIAYIDGRAAGAAPDGYVLVPKVPTEKMHVAAVRAIVRSTGNDDFPPAVWSAMIAASQQEKEKN